MWLCWPLIRIGVTNYIYCVDDVHVASHIVLESWDGDIDTFEGGAKAAAAMGAADVWSIIYEDSFNDIRKKHAYLLNASAAGIDTTHFSLIPVPKRDPKTLNIARAVLDAARQHHWTELAIVTFELHSARSRKAYTLAAKPYCISIHVIGIPLEGVTAKNWWTTSSGVAAAFSELVKRIYYDLLVF